MKSNKQVFECCYSNPTARAFAVSMNSVILNGSLDDGELEGTDDGEEIE